MKAIIEQKGDIFIVHFKGRIDYESADLFRKNGSRFLDNQKVIFNFADLSFVGSSGISPFVETIQDLFDKNNSNMKFCKVGSEFKKIFAANTLRRSEIYEDSNAAQMAFLNPALAQTLAYQFIEEEPEVEEPLLQSVLPEEIQIKE